MSEDRAQVKAGETAKTESTKLRVTTRSGETDLKRAVRGWEKKEEFQRWTVV